MIAIMIHRFCILNRFIDNHWEGLAGFFFFFEIIAR